MKAQEAAVAQTPTPSTAQETPAHKHVLLVFPTRYIDPYFRELGLGYQRNLPKGWTLGVNGGLIPRTDDRYEDLAPAIWGAALGLEARYRVAEWGHGGYFGLSTGADFSRVYFRTRGAVEPTDVEGVSRVVEAPAVARRNEFKLGLVFHQEWRSGFTLETTLGFGVGRLRYRLRNGVTPGPAPTNDGRFDFGHHEGAPLKEGEVLRLMWPRLRVGLGYAW